MFWIDFFFPCMISPFIYAMLLRGVVCTLGAVFFMIADSKSQPLDFFFFKILLTSFLADNSWY